MIADRILDSSGCDVGSGDGEATVDRKRDTPMRTKRVAGSKGEHGGSDAEPPDTVAPPSQPGLNQSQALYQLTAALSQAIALEDIFAAALAGIGQALGIERASILLFDPDGVMRFKAWRGLSDVYRRTTEGHTPWSADTTDARPIVVADVDDEPSLANLRSVIVGEGIRALAFVPLLHRGKLLGKFMLYAPTPYQFTAEEIQLAETIAGHIAVAVARRLDEEAIATARTNANIAAERAAFLAEISQILATSLDYADTLTSLARAALPFLGDACVIYHLVGTSTLRRLALAHLDAEIEQLLRELQRFEIPLESDVPAARVVRTGARVVENQVAATIGEQIHPDATYQSIVRTFAPQAYICVPLTARGRTLGSVAFIVTHHYRQYTAEDVTLAEEVAQRAALALDNARLYQEARDAVALRDQFLSIAAHELKTPLTVLLGNAQAMERRAIRDEHLPEREVRAVHLIHEQARRLSRMIAALLDISRLEQGKLSIERARFDLQALVERVVDEVQSGLTVHMVEHLAADEPVIVEGDELRLEQVLQNLIGNAVKYSLQGGVVQVQVARQADRACIRVTDHGMGIPAEDIPHLFERYYRASNIDGERITGMGIGLYIVKEIVTLHGGTVEIQSELGTGSTFTVSLPISHETGEMVQQRTGTDTPSSNA
jgi:signal transduction histidine kinase